MTDKVTAEAVKVDGKIKAFVKAHKRVLIVSAVAAAFLLFIL